MSALVVLPTYTWTRLVVCDHPMSAYLYLDTVGGVRPSHVCASLAYLYLDTVGGV